MGRLVTFACGGKIVSSPKERYAAFCNTTYVPIYSKSWWMDAVCEPEKWDVWLYEQGGNVVAAMPFYFEQRNQYRYITKAPLTQNNGIIFDYPAGSGFISQQKFEEKVINAACKFILLQGVDVYEQQYQYSFNNWLPFYWNNYSSLIRYTYVIKNTENLNSVWNNFSSNYRKNIKKGTRNVSIRENFNSTEFFDEHEKVFKRQGLESPFSRQLWERLYGAARDNASCKMLYAVTPEDEIASLLFLVWDERFVYHLLGGTMPGYQSLGSYNALAWEGIKIASEKGLSYDFEGSMIEGISKSFREFGGVPKPYFRIRKVFNPDIIRQEAEQRIVQLERESYAISKPE